MTPNQKSLYWRMWSKVRKSYIEFGGYSPEDADAERHHLHREALGTDKSSADFTNKDLDRVLDHFRTILVLAEGPTSGTSRAEEMPRRRLIWAIERTGLGDAYINSVVRDQFHTGDWRGLPERDLIVLRFTCGSRARSKRQAADLAG
jgi:hypothetical protein